MIRQLLAAGNATIVEAGCVVVCHRGLVVGVVLIHKEHLFYSIAAEIQLAEYLEQVVGYGALADNLTSLGLAVLINMEHAEVSQFLTGYCAVALIGLEPYALKHLVADGVGTEETVQIACANG